VSPNARGYRAPSRPRGKGRNNFRKHRAPFWHVVDVRVAGVLGEAEIADGLIVVGRVASDVSLTMSDAQRTCEIGKIEPAFRL
jgi:hypothetical protein